MKKVLPEKAKVDIVLKNQKMRKEERAENEKIYRR